MGCNEVAIRGYCQFALRHDKQGDKMRRNVTKIVTGSDSLVEMAFLRDTYLAS